MREVNEEYSAGAEQNIRDVSVEIITNEDSKTYTSDEILSVDIQRGITDGSFGVGFTQSDRLTFQVISDDKLPKKTRATIYISFDGSGSERLGRFYVDECTRDGSVLTITAFDKMKQLGEKTVRFSGTVQGKTSFDRLPLAFKAAIRSEPELSSAKLGELAPGTKCVIVKGSETTDPKTKYVYVKLAGEKSQWIVKTAIK